jgi:hypothetical protein
VQGFCEVSCEAEDKAFVYVASAYAEAGYIWGALMDESQKHDIRMLRQNFPVLAPYMDEDIARCYSEYCEEFHGASWTSVNSSAFVEWATTKPIER